VVDGGGAIGLCISSLRESEQLTHRPLGKLQELLVEMETLRRRQEAEMRVITEKVTKATFMVV
jgi:hypothetical protein